MVPVRELKTQSEAYWRDEYEVQPEDLDLVTGMILEAGSPQTVGTLAIGIVLRRFRAEKQAATEQTSRGRLYRPVEQVEVGEELVFPALEFVVGTVIGSRPGKNPKYGPFEVIRVRFGADVPGPDEREFASNFDEVHPLNRPLEELLLGEEEMDENELSQTMGSHVAVKLQSALRESDDFVYFDGTWFLQDLLPEIHVGHLNLAEAVIYEANNPVSSEDMLRELEIETTTSPQAQIFALNHALGDDPRFDNVSMTHDPVWYLRALQPTEIFHRPDVLGGGFSARGGEYVGITLVESVEEIGDELDDIPSVIVRQADQLTFELPFPHLFAGTLPVTQQWLQMLPSSAGSHFAITLVDTVGNREIEAWVLPDAHYVAGLGDWYADVGMCVGGRLVLTPTDDPLRYELSYARAKSRRTEWLRAASVEGGELILQMGRASVEVDCDREMLIDVPDREAVALLMGTLHAQEAPLSRLLRKAFAELAKLSSSGTVHAKGLYSAVNLLRRSGMVPILSELARNACFDPVGEGFWAYEPDLEGTLYQTPDEMRERPLSSRDDLVKDQVVQYLGR